MSVHPQVAHRLDARHLARLVTATGADVPFEQIRETFATWLARHGHEHDALPEAWNAWRAATRGVIEVRLARCASCHGRRFDPRAGGVCRTCAGTARGGTVRVRLGVWPAEHSTSL